MNTDIPIPTLDSNPTLDTLDSPPAITLVVSENNIENNSTIPKFIFIIPYRDRKEHKEFFSVYIKHVLEDIPKTDYEIYFVEQKNTLPFNRGAMKNIGFLAIKYKYPDNYKNITFVFNDVDTLPYSKNIIDYETTPGIVKHFYGFKFALGGIFSIRGEDFERTNGFPNFWSWGGEDNYMQKRVEYVGLYIDRSLFFNILDKNILQLCDGVKRLICRKEAATVVNMTTTDGLVTIRNLNYEFKDEYINVYNFQTVRDPRTLRFEEQNIATESKIRLEKDDVKNILDRKMNHNIGVSVGVGAQQRPQQRPQQYPRPQNIVIPQQRAMTAPAPAPAPVKITHTHPMHPPTHPTHPTQHPTQHPAQVIRKNIYSGIGLGGIK